MSSFFLLVRFYRHSRAKRPLLECTFWRLGSLGALRRLGPPKAQLIVFINTLARNAHFCSLSWLSRAISRSSPPRRLQDASKTPPRRPRCPQDAPKTPPRCLQDPQDASETPPRDLQDTPKTPKMPPRRPQVASKTRPRRPQDAPRRPKTPQDAPKTPQDSPKMAKTPPGRPKGPPKRGFLGLLGVPGGR